MECKNPKCDVLVSDTWYFCNVCGHQLRSVPKRLPVRGKKWCATCEVNKSNNSRLDNYEDGKYKGKKRFDSDFCTQCGTKLLNYEEARLLIPVEYEKEILEFVTKSSTPVTDSMLILAFASLDAEITTEKREEIISDLKEKGTLKVTQQTIYSA